eukprot:CAMPEP_0177775366 /NCGR_PEP_ID=MMETSP0491_2-20121128/14054_1 /TAXON_ID=63592 /ORGANISM="Tetraselmis chuii, Strain PLY429" /LENGTH=326 /DNA_ID=CAMNT_0019293911 /DNA_START=1286 /DNA_END=2269 /DNA_ORIENTATION=-
MNARNATWDLCLNEPYLDGGFENSTRVFGSGGWEMEPPLRAAVRLNGPHCSLNDPSQRCRSWTAEVALPIAMLRFNTSAPPPRADRDFWRINFSRVQWHVVVAERDECGSGGRVTLHGSQAESKEANKYLIRKDGNLDRHRQTARGASRPSRDDKCLPHYEKDGAFAATDPDNWVWSPQGVVDMHRPERWGVLQFAGHQVNDTAPAPYPNWSLRHIAMSLYDAQRAHISSAGLYSSDIDLLRPLAPPFTLDGRCCGAIHIEVSPDGRSYTAEVLDSSNATVAACISDDRLLTIDRPGLCHDDDRQVRRYRSQHRQESAAGSRLETQ